LNIARAPNVLSAITNLKPSVIVNCAAWTDVDGAEDKEDEAFRVNADGAENVAIAAKRCGAKLVHVSTDYVFSGESQSPWQIADEMNPQSAYGRTKAHGERRVLETYFESSLIVRTAWLYSPWGKNFAKTMTNLAIKGVGEVKVVNDQVGQPTSATDLARQLVELGLSTSPAGVYHGTNSGQATWFEFAQEIFKLTGADVSRVIPVSSGEFPRPAKRPSFSVLSHDAWANTSIKPMMDWRMALAVAMPAIIFSVRAGE
jgi:dTDP-4-dehydrorhamnose reductase